jgi:acetyl-CoA carboxylase carboxyltransferase component
VSLAVDTARVGTSAYDDQRAELDARMRVAGHGRRSQARATRASGHLNARERIEQLLDAGSFNETVTAVSAVPADREVRRPTPRSLAPAASKVGAWPWCRTT